MHNISTKGPIFKTLCEVLLSAVNDAIANTETWIVWKNVTVLYNSMSESECINTVSTVKKKKKKLIFKK